MPLRKERARTALCHWVVPETPVPALMPERLGWLMSWTAPSAAMARPVNSPTNCCTCARSFSLPANTFADEAMPIIFGLMSRAASSNWL